MVDLVLQELNKEEHNIMPILLEELPNIIIQDDLGGLARTFNYKKFDPNKTFKQKSDTISLSYSTLGQYKECKFKFLIRNILGLSFFKQNESLFVGNVIHKFLEVLIKTYETKGCDPYKFKPILINQYEEFMNLFDRRRYSTNDDFVKTIIMFINDKKKFEPDIFFDDYQYINYVSQLEYNYFVSRKELLMNAIDLIKEMLKFSHKYKVDHFNVEQWFSYVPENIDILFRGKIDLYFSYKTENRKKWIIVDYKTGNVKYFDWNQLHFYALAIGIIDFNDIHEYFFDIKESKAIQNTDCNTKEKVLSGLVSQCSEIQEYNAKFQKYVVDIREKYREEMLQILNSVKIEEIHRVPFMLLNSIFNSCINVFLEKEFKKKSYFPTNSTLCKWCDYYANCPKFM